ncbi:MAG TPA: hypothetical protein VMT16_11475 [Thermoanaerobaculia bacterium]|nr:hypothetical protein [Thermoanaerobaculia bacterium]
MSSPEYLVCLNCEAPCYVFEWEDGAVVEALCTACGNDEADQFITEEDFDAISGD